MLPLQLFYCYFIADKITVKEKNIVVGTKRAEKFAESPINDNNLCISLIIISYHS
jgi:hypothetical protein